MHKPTSAAIQEQLDNSILKGLQLEWQAIHQELAEEYRSRIRLPVFRLTGGIHPTASWTEAGYLLSFSREFILGTDWGSLIEVLRHEMAHQLASSLDGARKEPPHGPLFRKACDILHADPRATGTRRILQDSVRDDTPQDRLIRKVRLLMQLAESENPHESALAAAKANELITKYNLAILETPEKRSFVSLFLGEPALRHAASTVSITALLEAHYFVQVVWISSYVLAKGKMGRVPEVSGTPPNVLIASYVFDYLQQYITSRWDEYRRKEKSARKGKAGFALGIVDGFRKTLDKRKSETMEGYRKKTTPNHLVLLEDDQLNHYVGFRYHRLRSFRRASDVDPSAYSAGKTIGEKLVISKGIDHQPVESGRLLPW
ncbi:MAG: DUF7168 domain-containing protein [Thermodesulfobacteriota bacterium]